MTNLEAFIEKELILEVDGKFKEYKLIQDLISKCIPIPDEKYIEYVKRNPECKFLTVDNFSVLYSDSEYECKIVLTTNCDGKNTIKAQDFVEEYRAKQYQDNFYDFINSNLALEVDEDTGAIDALQELVERSTEVWYTSTAGNKGCAKELANKAIVKYGIGNACISFDSKMFRWCSKQWYIDDGYRIMHVRDFIAQYHYHEPDTNAEDEWEKLYKEYTGENDE